MTTLNSINGVTASDQIVQTQNTGVDRADGSTADNEAFADLLSEAIDGLTENSGIDTANGMMSGSFLPMPSLSNTLEQAIMTASSSGDSNDAMVALLMLMMMMQSGSSGGGDMSMMMQMMSSMIGQMQDKEGLRNDFLYNSGGHPFTLDQIDELVFGKVIPKTTGTENAALPLQWWKPTTPAVVNTQFNRHPELYRNVVKQFDVEKDERYRPGREGNTYCNIYVWDVTRAMGAELPFYTDPKTGAPREYPDTKGANVMGAKAMDKWLKTHGPTYGWRQATAEQAQMHANSGRPAVASGGDKGHISMVVPSSDGRFDTVRGVAIAQAGRKNSNYMHISGVYNSSTLNSKVTYWIHN